MSVRPNINLDDNIISGNGSAKYSAVADRISDCANQHLKMLMNQMLNIAVAGLDKEATQSKSETERDNIRECARLIRKSSDDINYHFFARLNKSLSVSADETTEDDENTLVNQDEMDEMVAITTMYSKAMNAYGDDVKHLEARLEYLEIMYSDIFDKEALDPKHICEIYKDTIESIDTDIAVKLVFYKLFDQEVCTKLGVMYMALNRILIDNDILPEIVLSTTQSHEIEYNEEVVSSRVATFYDPEEKIHTDFIPRTKEEISRIVNDFMSGEMTITGDEIELPESFLRTPTQQDLDGKNCYQRKEVLRALSNLQRKLISLQNKSGSLTTSQIKQGLIDDIEGTHKGRDEVKKVNLLDERSMDFVGLMFDAIANDESISDIMTSMINRLQIPVMKLAMTDKSMFEQEDHPARVVIDLLTTAGKGISTEAEVLYKKLLAVVDDILTNFDNDISTFEAAAYQIREIIHNQKELAGRQEKQQQKQILLNHAKHIITTQLKLLFCDRKIPDQLRKLVLKNWSTLMLNRYIRHGRGSMPWVQSVLLLKLLIKCIQPIRIMSQYKLVSNNHIALAEVIEDELFETQQDKAEITVQIASLKKHFSKIIEHYNFTSSNDTVEKLAENETFEAETDDTEHEVRQFQQQLDAAQKKISQLSSSTRPGVWYEIYIKEEKVMRRLKLSVILNDAAQLVFVDHKGVKVVEKDAAEFARELKENRSREIADHSTFDHALGRVIGRMAA